MEAPEISVMFAAVCDLDPLWKRPIVAPPPSNPEMSGASWRDEETTGGDATPGAQPRGQTVLSLSPASLLFDDADDKETVLAKANHRRTSGYGTSGDVQDSLRVRGRVFASDRRDTDDERSRELQPRQRRTEGSRDVSATPGDREPRDDGRCATGDDYFRPVVHGRDTGRRSDYRLSVRDDKDSYRRCDSNESETGSPVQRRVSHGFARNAERVSPRRASASRGRKQLRSAVVVPDKTTRRADLSTEDEGSRQCVDHKGRLSSDRRRRNPERRGHSARHRHRRSRQSGSSGRRRGRGHQGSPGRYESSTNDEAHIEQRLHRIRLRTFDGKGSFETFLAHFQNCADYNRWGKKDKLAHLKAALVGDAGQVLWDSDPSSVSTLDKLVTLLRNRYGGTRQADKHHMDLRLRRRQAGESLSALHQDIRRLMALAHPSLGEEARESIACDYFVDALNDADFALKCESARPVL